MLNCESSDISRCLKYGYPYIPVEPECCCICDEALGEYAYDFPEGAVCEECFKDLMQDYARLCPGKLAEDLGISRRYLA